MTRKGYLNVRMDENLMGEVHAIFNTLGLSAGDALTLIYNQVKLHQGFPFDVKIPNNETLEAMHQAANRENLTTYSSAEKMFADLEIDI